MAVAQTLGAVQSIFFAREKKRKKGDANRANVEPLITLTGWMLN